MENVCYRTLNTMMEGCQIIGFDWRYLYVNDACALHARLQKDALIGRSMLEAYPGIETTEMYQTLRRCMTERVASHMENRFVYPDGRSGWFDLSIQPVPDGLLILSIDITARKTFEDKLAQAQKMEAVGRLAGGVAHDFNNMLQVIQSHVELALDSIEQGSPVLENLEEIGSAARRSAELTRQLLAFARQQPINPKPLDLNVTISGMLKMLCRLIGENIDLGWTPGEGLWTVRMDPSQIDQILTNLVVNARDAIQGTGKIDIATINMTIDESVCEIQSGLQPGAYVLLSLSDTGGGMKAETLEHIFEPFYTTKEKGKGTGLGLSTVHGIVKQNNGYVNAYSELGIGTIFRVYLPRDGTNVEQEDKSVEIPAPLGTETILFVEDEESILKVGTTILRRHGFTVLAARSPNEALEISKRRAEDIKLLITDVVMPGMNGRELMAGLQCQVPDLRTLFISGYTANVIAHHQILEPGIHFLQKPFSEKTLIKKVAETLADR